MLCVGVSALVVMPEADVLSLVMTIQEEMLVPYIISQESAPPAISQIRYFQKDALTCK